MVVAYLPSPARGTWQLGPLPVRGYAVCAILGIVAGLWLTERRYRSMGGPRGLGFDVALVAVPAGIIGARIYGVLTAYGRYFGPGRDWAGVFRIWDGGLGMAGMVAAGALGAWLYCRRRQYALAPLAVAAAPALAIGQAVAVWGNWFNQRMYGAPSSLPWAVAIDPERRAKDYESFATFQPVFLYECLWDLLVAAVVLYAIHRFALRGDRAFAMYAGLYAAGRFGAELLRIDYSPRVLGTRVTELVMLLMVIAAGAYLAFSRPRRRRPADTVSPASAGEVPAPAGPPVQPGGPVLPDGPITAAGEAPLADSPAPVVPAARPVPAAEIADRVGEGPGHGSSSVA